MNTVGLRTPKLSLYDIKRAWEILGGWLGLGKRKPAAVKDEPEKTKADPEVLRPFMLPWYQFSWVENLNHALIARAVRRRVIQSPGKKPLLVSTLPIIPELFRQDYWYKRVYYCVDDFTTWPGVSGEVMKRLEARTLAHCDVLIATSSALQESRGKAVTTSNLLTHGVDINHFAKAREAVPAPEIKALPSPVVGLFGSFDPRIDGDLLKRVALAVAPGSVVVLGPVDRSLNEFQGVANLHFLGAKPYADLPAFVAGMAALILPYRIDASTHNINPLKLKEYLATGLPVIATPLPEILRLGGDTVVAQSEDFVSAVLKALASPRPDWAKRQAFLSRETWDAKAETFCHFLLDHADNTVVPASHPLRGGV